VSTTAWTVVIVGATFALYLFIALRSRASTTGEFYVAGKGVPPIANGMATAADWMSAASFMSMAGVISFAGYDGSVYLMGWTGGYVLLALLLAPYLRKFGRFTVPDFIGDRYESSAARIVAVVAAIFISFTYVAGQMRGVGLVFSRFLEVEVETGVLIGMGVVFVYAVLGGMKGITYTQVAQYVVLIFAFMVPAIFISLQIAGTPVPQIGFGSTASGSSTYLLDRLDGLHRELGFHAYTERSASRIELFATTLALMVGTAGLPHVIIRFYTVPRVRDARSSAGWALVFIAVLYTTAPAVAVFARTNLIESLAGKPWSERPAWVEPWLATGLIKFDDVNADGLVQYVGPAAIDEASGAPIANELVVDKDIMVLANPEIAGLPNWVTGLVAAGALAAALSTAAGLLLVISTSISHDLLKRTLMPSIGERGELWSARLAAAAGVVVAGWLGINPPGFVSEVVAFAFGLAAASFFPAIVMGIFSRRMNRHGAIAGLVTGLVFTAGYIVWFKFLNPELASPENYLLGISPTGIGSVGMVLNFAVALTVARFTPPPSRAVQELVSSIRTPRGAGAAHEIQVG
jgi:cation/acetate symporter